MIHKKTCSILFLFTFFSLSLSGVEFNIVYAPEIMELQDGDQSEQLLFNKLQNAINTAAEDLGTRFSDNIVLNFTIIGRIYSPLVTAAARPIAEQYKYTEYKNALVKDARSAEDKIALANIPSSDVINFYRRDQSEMLILDTDKDMHPENNENIFLTRPNAKAVGLIAPNDPGIDGYLIYNLGLDPEFVLQIGVWKETYGSQISAFQFNVMGGIKHEFYHALGFIGQWVGDQTEGTEPIMALDLFRYSQNELVEGEKIQAPDISFDGESYFSIDGGLTQLAEMSLDGGGAHWVYKEEFINGSAVETSPFGIMAWRANQGILQKLSNIDLIAMDVIGYDIFEPPTAGQVSLNVRKDQNEIKGKITAKPLSSDLELMIVPDYQIQHSADLQTWTDFSEVTKGGLTNNFERHFEAKVQETGAQFFNVVGKINLPGADLSRLNLDRALFEDANLENAILVASDLRHSNLNRANLKGADLTGASIHHATLISADLTNSNLKGVNFFGADLEGAILDGAHFENTIMPDGSIKNKTNLANP
jgi:hypothetical protein